MKREIINYSRKTYLKYNTARDYINTIINIYHSQITLDLYNYPNPRDMKIKAYLKKNKPPITGEFAPFTRTGQLKLFSTMLRTRNCVNSFINIKKSPILRSNS
jgi:hypothetical protein